jgi:ABC-type Fe3+ transport system permease subunit
MSDSDLDEYRFRLGVVVFCSVLFPSCWGANVYVWRSAGADWLSAAWSGTIVSVAVGLVSFCVLAAVCAAIVWVSDARKPSKTRGTTR